MSSSALAAGLRHLRGKLAVQQHNDDSDEQLLHAFLANRDDNAFAVLVRRHGPMVLHVCRRVLGHEQDAEDAFQATFLVLSRQAARLRKKASLASFLHGIAYRIALKAKRATARRRKHESSLGAQTRPCSPADPADDLSWREVRSMLDDEIARLPEKYRSVFVLFYLEDCGREETARRLGLKEGTVASRLDTARKRLQQRLARRGVELTAVLAASALAAQPASALSPLLISTTIKAALSEATAGVVSASVAELVKSATTAMMVSKAKMATVVLLTVSMLAGASAWWSGGLKTLSGGRQPPERSETQGADAPRSAKRPPAKTMEIQGRVLGPDGKPKAGAKILLLSDLDPSEVRELLFENGKVQQLGVSAVDGRFTVAVSKTKERRSRYLIAQCDGIGIDFFDAVDLKPGKPLEFRLVKDHAIRGRIVNTEGKPVPGVRVAVNQLCTYPNNSLDSFLVYWKNRPFNLRQRDSLKDIWSGADVLLSAPTDADGRFVLHGVGAERFLSLRLSGGGIGDDEVWVVNRAGFDPKPYNQATLDNIPKGKRGFHGWMLSGPDVTVIAEAEKIIRGVVTEADTGKGRPGVIVRVKGRSLDNRAKTDAQGRYEIRGARKAKSYRIEVGSDTATGCLGRAVRAEDTLGYRPVIADIRVRKGVIVTGRMIEKATGKTLEGTISEVKHDIVLERKNVLGVVKIQDAEGRPLDEAIVLAAARMEGDTCTFYGEASDLPKLLIFYESKQKLVGKLAVKAGEKLPPVVKLHPMGSVKGRLLGADGKPLEGIVVAPRYRHGIANGMQDHVHEARPIASDANGDFTLDSLIPELPFELAFRRGRREFARDTKSADATIQVKPGACRDVGAIKLKLLPEKKGE